MRLSAPSASAGRRVHALLLALWPTALLAACATPPQATARFREPPLSYPPSTRERIVRFALTEWQDWGGYVTTPGEKHPPSKAPGPESAIANFPRVLAYWRAVEEDRPVIDRNRDPFAADCCNHAGMSDGKFVKRHKSHSFLHYILNVRII